MDSFLWFSMIAIVVTMVASMVAFHRANTCLICNTQLTSKKYLWLDTATGIAYKICRTCFYNNISKKTPEEQSAN